LSTRYLQRFGATIPAAEFIDASMTCQQLILPIDCERLLTRVRQACHNSKFALPQDLRNLSKVI